MSLDTMAFVLGGLLIAASVFGGGLEIKELKMPQIGGAPRLIAAVAGIAFVALALAINQKWIDARRDAAPTASAPAGTPADGGSKTFQAPMFGNLRLDACLEWGTRCGEEAATAWCKSQGYLRSTAYTEESVGDKGVSTRLIGTNQVCTAVFCDSFAEITCAR